MAFCLIPPHPRPPARRPLLGQQGSASSSSQDGVPASGKEEEGRRGLAFLQGVSDTATASLALCLPETTVKSV